MNLFFGENLQNLKENGFYQTWMTSHHVYVTQIGIFLFGAFCLENLAWPNYFGGAEAIMPASQVLFVFIKTKKVHSKGS